MKKIAEKAIRNDSVYDAVVIGLGAVGSFALRALSKSKTNGRYLGVEGFELGHSHGSSHGATRIYRQAYFEHPNYVPWIKYSVSVFQELGVPLLVPSGCLIIEERNMAENSSEMPPYCMSSWEAAQEHSISVDYLNSERIKTQFPQFRHDSERAMVGLLESPATSGMVRCEEAMAAALKECSNIEIWEKTRVLSYECDKDGVVVRLQRGNTPTEIVCRKLLVSAGAWTGSLVPEWSQWLTPTRQLQGWIEVENRSLTEMPSWVWSSSKYPLPCYGLGGDPLSSPNMMKFGIHGRKQSIPDLASNSSKVTTSEISELTEAASWVFSDLLLDSVGLGQGRNMFQKIMPCIYTMTPDSNYLIGEPRKNVFCVAGLSGHGFKVAPALGQMMADYVDGADIADKWGTTFCSSNRFN